MEMNFPDKNIIFQQVDNHRIQKEAFLKKINFLSKEMSILGNIVKENCNKK